ncbi:MAG: tetratricopeptide repeat protein [Acidobacteria bacterium]|nr:MAG: tetratricopeptide repeat protein [Acidobacteriota bacterium]
MTSFRRTNNPETVPKAGQEGGRRETGKPGAFLIAALILFAALPYLNTLLNGFVYDDNRQVLDNPYLKNFHFLPQVFGTTVWSFVGMQGVSNYYRPMMTFGYAVCYHVFGPLAYGFHLVNVLLHVGVVLLVFAVARRLFKDTAVAFLAACLFAVHPIHTEAVAWVAAVTSLEVTFFYLLTFWLFLCIARPHGGISPWFKLAAVVSFALTIFSKEQALMLPLVAMIYEHFFRDDRAETTFLQKARRYGEFWLMDLAYVLFRVEHLGAFAPQVQLSRLGWYPSVLSSLALAGQYLEKLFWPVKLCAYYVFHKGNSIFDPRVLAGIAALSACLMIFVLLYRRNRTASFGFVWFFLTLAPVLDIRYLAGNVFAERYLYLPSVGFCWLMGWAGIKLWKSLSARASAWRHALLATSCALGLLMAVRVVARNRDWRSDEALYSQTLKVSPRATNIRENLGVVAWNHGRISEAEKEWNIALKLNPNSPITLTNLGLVYARGKQYQLAEQYFRQAMLRKPDYTDPHLNLGSMMMDQGRFDEAEPQLRAAAALSPLVPSCHNQLGKLYLKEGRLSEAAAQFSQSVRAAQNFEGYEGLGDVYLQQRDLDRAGRAYAAAAEINPYDSRAYFGLAHIAVLAGHQQAALAEYARGFVTDPNNQEARSAVQLLRVSGNHEREISDQ